MHRTPRRDVLAALMTLAFAAPAAVLAAEPPPEASASKPIARIWRGRTLATRADEYEKYLVGSGITRIEATPGNLGVTLLRRADGKETEFVVISIWESIEAVKRFAGKDYEKAVILAHDREYLLEVEPTVKHYDIEKEERKR
jgi:heme-degrading monooxygenase HmoA